MRLRGYIHAAAVLFAGSALAVEPQAPATPLTIDQAVEFALAHHPALQADAANEEVRREQVAVARAGYLPKVDLSLEINGGTGNVLRGAVVPLPGIPFISGPPATRQIGDVALGSMVGVGASWDALGMVDKMAIVDAALAADDQARATLAARRLAIAYGAADQFLDVITRAETVRSASASVERARVFDTIVEALTRQDLRPGADASRAQAELALAATQLIRAQQAEDVSRVELARTLGVAGERVTIDPGALLALAPVGQHQQVKHPLVIEAEAAQRAALARRRAVELQYLPRLDLFAALWVRGSGFGSGSLSGSPGDGIVPDTPNWLGGLALTWPAVELVAVRARTRVENAQVKVADARRREVIQAVQSQIDAARAILVAARREAANTPIELQAARAAEAQATARYRAGLATVVEVAEAQRLLAQAEIDDAVARLAVRRAELLVARAIGDLNPFLDEARGR
jgi:outer membrane protein TolC